MSPSVGASEASHRRSWTLADTRQLQPDFRPWAELLLEVLRDEDPGYRITSAKRSFTEQVALYARWLAGAVGIYTPARPGTSQHERGWAVDIASPRTDPKADPLLAELGRAWRSAGGVWGGEKDPVHFEAPKEWTGRS